MACATHCKQTIIWQDGRETTNPHYPIHFLDHHGEVRSGFEKGTLKKVAFELHNGATIVYEDTGEKAW